MALTVPTTAVVVAATERSGPQLLGAVLLKCTQGWPRQQAPVAYTIRRTALNPAVRVGNGKYQLRPGGGD